MAAIPEKLLSWPIVFFTLKYIVLDIEIGILSCLERKIQAKPIKIGRHLEFQHGD
jgi:hypothetical protein